MKIRIREPLNNWIVSTGFKRSRTFYITIRKIFVYAASMKKTNYKPWLTRQF